VLGVSSRTLRNWKQEPLLRTAWDQLSKHVIGDPSKVQEVLEEMRQLALARHIGVGTNKDGVEVFERNTQQVAAAKAYLAAVEAIKPPSADLGAKAAAELTDAELEAMLAAEAQKRLNERQRTA